jgi:hypothetical protein
MTTKPNKQDPKTPAGNIGFCNIGADGITMNICNSIWHLFGQTSFNLAFCCYLHHQFFNWASVPGGHFSNSPTSQSPVRSTFLPAFINNHSFEKTFANPTSINAFLKFF